MYEYRGGFPDQKQRHIQTMLRRRYRFVKDTVQEGEGARFADVCVPSDYKLLQPVFAGRITAR